MVSLFFFVHRRIDSEVQSFKSSSSEGTDEGLVDSFPSGFQAAIDTAGFMIVSYSMGVNLPSARWRLFRW